VFLIKEKQMKATLLLAALLFSAGIAYADHHDSSYHDGIANPKNINTQNLGRRPYTANPQTKPEKFEGDVADIEETKAEKNYKTLQLHMLGKRPYAEK
jgi:hypothetical protein